MEFDNAVSHVDLDYCDAILVTTFDSKNPNELGKFLNKACSKGKTIVLSMFANCDEYSYPKGGFDAPVIPGPAQ
jgi:hypothetical protein